MVQDHIKSVFMVTYTLIEDESQSETNLENVAGLSSEEIYLDTEKSEWGSRRLPYEGNGNSPIIWIMLWSLIGMNCAIADVKTTNP
jgi:hypothetical protein